MAEPLGLRDLPGLQAARAHVNALGGATLGDPHLLEVRVEPPLGGDHGVRAGLPEGGTLAAGMTHTSHAAAKHSVRGWWVRFPGALLKPGTSLPARALSRRAPRRQRWHGQCVGGSR